MPTITLQEAGQRFAEIVHGLSAGEVLTIIENDRPIANLSPIPSLQKRPPRARPPMTGVPRAGALEGRLVVPDDLKEPLEEMREYMQ